MKYQRFAVGIVIGALVVVAGTAVVLKGRDLMPFSGKLMKDSGDGVSDYSAVFLSNGQVYFGKLYKQDDGYVDLRDIYYLKVNQQLQPSNTRTTPSASPALASQPKISLSKLGSELHGPNDEMHINRSQILFTESLKEDSQVVKEIAASKSK